MHAAGVVHQIKMIINLYLIWTGTHFLLSCFTGCSKASTAVEISKKRKRVQELSSDEEAVPGMFYGSSIPGLTACMPKYHDACMKTCQTNERGYGHIVIVITCVSCMLSRRLCVYFYGVQRRQRGKPRTSGRE